MSTDILPPLPTKVRQLLDLPPTLESVGTFAEACSVSDVVTGIGRTHDLLLPTAEEWDRYLADFKRLSVRLDPGERSAIEFGDERPGVSLTGADVAGIAAAYEEQFGRVRQLCAMLGDWWNTAFNAYKGEHEPDYQSAPLYLVPHVGLPDPRLIHELASPAGGVGHPKRAWYLLILTARHELGHLVRFAIEWREKLADVKRDRYATVGDMPPAVSAPFLDALHSRVRKHAYRKPVVARDSLGWPYAHGEEAVAWESDLDRLYGETLGWYDEVYRRVLTPKVCAWCRSHLVPTGRRVYCTEACMRAADVKKSARRHQKR